MHTQITSIIYFFFLHLIRIESTSQNNSVNAIKKARKLFNEARSTLSCEEINEISYL